MPLWLIWSDCQIYFKGTRHRQSTVLFLFHFLLCPGNTLMNFQLGWYAHAIFVDGQYPAVSGDSRSQSWSEPFLRWWGIRLMRRARLKASTSRGYQPSLRRTLPWSSAAATSWEWISTQPRWPLRAGLLGDLSQNQIVYPEASDPELVDFYAGRHRYPWSPPKNTQQPLQQASIHCYRLSTP